jgi:hypothetical protein
MQLRIFEIQSDAIVPCKYHSLGSSRPLHEFTGSENHLIHWRLGRLG